MAQRRVFANVVDHRLIDGGQTVEDVTSVGLPDVSHPTTNISGSGMAGSIDMPDTTRVDPMTLTINHNNGINCAKLARAGVHNIEFRAARQRFNTGNANMGTESVKFRVQCVHQQTQKGNIESGNPFGSTETYSVIRYEEIVNGRNTVLVDVARGIVEFDGIRYSDDVQSLLD